MRAEMPGPKPNELKHARIQQTAWVLFFDLRRAQRDPDRPALPVRRALAVRCPLSRLRHDGHRRVQHLQRQHRPFRHGARTTTDPLIEMTITLFMFLAGTNFMLLYALGRFSGRKQSAGRHRMADLHVGDPRGGHAGRRWRFGLWSTTTSSHNGMKQPVVEADDELAQRRQGGQRPDADRNQRHGRVRDIPRATCTSRRCRPPDIASFRSCRS